jgi:hypothetical protein
MSNRLTSQRLTSKRLMTKRIMPKNLMSNRLTSKRLMTERIMTEKAIGVATHRHLCLEQKIPCLLGKLMLNSRLTWDRVLIMLPTKLCLFAASS